MGGAISLIEVLRAGDIINTSGMLEGGEKGISSQSFENTMVRSDSFGWFDCRTQPGCGVL